MSDATGRARIERRLIERSIQDDAFRQRLVEDPRGTMEQELGVQLPADVQVEAVEETANTIYLVLPGASSVSEGAELSDRDLEVVAGGAPGGTWTCSGWTCGPTTCQSGESTCGTDCTG